MLRSRQLTRPVRRTVAVAAAAAALAALSVAVLPAAGAQPATRYAPHTRVVAARSTGAHPWLNRRESPQRRANQLLAAMTLADKVTMLHGVDTGVSPVPTVGYIPANRRLGIPPITMTDGPAGVRNGQRSTELPAPIALAATWDRGLAEKYGTVLGRDARDLGQDVLFGPGMNIDRVALNGRNFEYFSEDPLLSGTIAGADVRGIQSRGVIATIKHYVANNSETNRMSISADVGDRALHEIYEKNFGIAVAEGHPGAAMCSYNLINSVYSCSNPSTLGDLRRTFGFDGTVVSDYPATHATTDIAAGLNIELPTGVNLTLSKVQAALADGTLTMTDVNRRVRQTLIVLFRFGIFDRALTVSEINQQADNAVAQKIAERGAVLLKNANRALPLTSADKKIAIIGGPAKTSAQGGGSSQVDPLSVDNAYDAIVSRAGPGATVTYDPGTDPTSAANAATGADAALVFVRDTSSEGSDRSTLALSGNQDQVVQSVAAANPNTIVVLETGAPALMPWLSQVSGALEAWYPGARGGAAIAALLFGDVDPSGRLQQTWPTSDAQVPTSTPAQFPGVDGHESYSEGIDVGYRWYDDNGQQPLFPFGYGLSYTTFKLTHLALGRASGTSHDGVPLHVDVTNTGTRAGVQTVQVYVSKPHNRARTPVRELAAFARVLLAPGQTKRVAMTIAPRELAYWDSDAQAFTVQDGHYTVAAGTSSRALPLSADYRVTRTTGPVRFTVTPTDTQQNAGSAFTVSGTITNLSDYADKNVSVHATVPSGWTVRATTPTSFPTVGVGRHAAVTYRVRVPAGTSGGRYQVQFTSTGHVDNATVQTARLVTVTVPYPSLDAAYDTVGLTHDSNPAPGDFDPGGYSYSAESLADNGVTPGSTIEVNGSRVRFPAQDPGTPDAVTARGQVIDVGQSTAHLVLLGAGTNGMGTGTIRVTYTDGSTQDVPVSFADWYSNTAAPGTTVVVTARWNQPPSGGIGDHDVSIYGATANTDASKTIATITLPSSATLHLFTVSPERSGCATARVSPRC